MINRYMMLTGFFFLLFCGLIFYSLKQPMPEMGSLSPEMHYKKQMTQMAVLLLSAVILGCAAIYSWGIFVTHRFAGPMFVIHRLLDELIAGNYTAEEIKLRKKDEMQELALKVNTLRKTLAEKYPDQKIS